MAVRKLSIASIATGSKTNKFWDQFTYIGSYDSIATSLVTSGGASTISFTNIPADYRHLQIRYICRTSLSGTNSGMYMKFNNSSTGYHYLGGGAFYTNGTTATGAAGWQGTSTAGGAIGQPPGANIATSVFSAGVVDILDYTDANKNTSVNTFSGYSNNTSGYQVGLQFFWDNTAAVTRIDIVPDHSLVQHSRFALYGIKGA